MVYDLFIKSRKEKGIKSLCIAAFSMALMTWEANLSKKQRLVVFLTIAFVLTIALLKTFVRKFMYLATLGAEKVKGFIILLFLLFSLLVAALGAVLLFKFIL